MEGEKMKKCSFKEHKEIDAISYCQECKVYMCNKCSNHHQGLCHNHHQINYNKDMNEIFIDICKEENHPNNLQYFVKIIINYVVPIVLQNLKAKEMVFIKIAIYVLLNL